MPNPKDPALRFGEFDDLFAKLGLKSGRASGFKVKARLASEGFQNLELAGFVAAFRRRLGRQGHFFREIRGSETDPNALLDFIRLSTCECKLALARYLFVPDEVADRIIAQLRTSKGIPAPFSDSTPPTQQVTRAARKRLPPFEAKILDRLLESSHVFWVSPRTSTSLNSLVEHPKGSVVAVIKPPGSDIEIELKRVGIPGKNPLNAIFSKDGKDAPPSHRLDGGSMIWTLLYEAGSSSRFSAIFHCVHDREFNCALTHKVSSKYTIPTAKGERLILDYLTEPTAFGKGYKKMRNSMSKSVEAGFSDSWRGVRDLPGDLGLSFNFLIQYWPGQAIQTGSSSYRIDLAQKYLSAAGPALYFGDKGSTFHEKRWFAEQLVEEILGKYQRPSGHYRSYTGFVRAAFSLPGNRNRANRAYQRLLAQLGEFWGTLFAIGGYSNGESFVARNIGFKSSFQSGRWQVNAAFMDHDDLHIAPKHLDERPFLKPLIKGMLLDKRFVEDTLRILGSVYRISPEGKNEGTRKFHASARNSFRKTRLELKKNSRLRELFRRPFLQWLEDLDLVIGDFVKLRASPSAHQSWEHRAREVLWQGGSDRHRILDHLQVIREHQTLFRIFHS